MRKNVALLTATLVTAALGSQAARAQFTWNGSKNTDWNDPANWAGGAGFPNAAGASATFQTSQNGFKISLSAAVTLNSLTFNNADNHGWTISNQTLNFDSGNGSNSVITAVRGANKIASDITFNKNNLVFDTQAGTNEKIASVTVTGVISSTDATKSLIKTGPGILTLSATNTYAGPTRVNAGELVVKKDGALGTGAGTTTVANRATLTFASVDYKTAQPVSLLVGSTLKDTGNSTLTGPITVQSSATPGNRVTVDVEGNGTLTLNGAVGQSRKGANSTGILKSGSGTLVLATANNFASSLTIGAGVVKVTANDALGTTAGKTLVGLAPSTQNPFPASGTLTFSNVTYTTAEPVIVQGAGNRGLAINNDAGKSSFAGPIALQVSPGAVDPATGKPTPPNADFGAAKGTELTLTGVISGKGQHLTKVDAGTIILSPAAAGGNTYSGGTTIQAGTLIVTANAALGPGTGGTNILSGGTLGFQGGVTYTTAEAVKIAGANFGNGPTAITSLGGTNSFAGPITLQGSAQFNVDAGNGSQLTLSGAIGEAGGSWKLTKVGGGTLQLSGANTYTGGTEVMAGKLIAANNAALGAPGMNALTQVDNGATLGLTGGITLDNQKISIAGTGVDGKGAIYNIAGNNTIGKNAPVTLTANATIGAADGTNLKFLGTVDKNGTILTVTPGKGATIVFQDNATNQAIKGGGDVIVDGPGKVVIASGSTYTGPTVVNQGTLEVDNTVGSATSYGHVTVNSGATLQGTGIITGPVAVAGGAVLHPGTDQPGVLSTLGGVTLAPSALFQVVLGGTEAGNGSGFHSQLLVSGGTSLNGSILDVELTAPPVPGAEYDILRNLDNQPVNGRFTGLSEGTVFDVSSPFGTYAFMITYFGGNDIYHDGSDNDVVLTDLGAVAVPEPYSLVTFASGLAGLFGVGLWRRHRREMAFGLSSGRSTTGRSR